MTQPKESLSVACLYWPGLAFDICTPYWCKIYLVSFISLIWELLLSYFCCSINSISCWDVDTLCCCICFHWWLNYTYDIHFYGLAQNVVVWSAVNIFTYHLPLYCAPIYLDPSVLCQKSTPHLKMSLKKLIASKIWKMGSMIGKFLVGCSVFGGDQLEQEWCLNRSTCFSWITK